MFTTKCEKSCVTFSDGIRDADGTYFGAQEVSMGMSCKRRNKSCKRSILHDICVSSKSCGNLCKPLIFHQFSNEKSRHVIYEVWGGCGHTTQKVMRGS